MKQGFNYKNDILTPGGVNFADQNSEEDISGWGWWYKIFISILFHNYM